VAISAKTGRGDQIVASHLSSVAFEGAPPAESADRGLSSVCIVGVR